MIPKWLYEHSLSIALATGWAASSWIAWLHAKPENNFPYDFWQQVAGDFGGSAILVILARWLWERDSAPDQPPPPRT